MKKSRILYHSVSQDMALNHNHDAACRLLADSGLPYLNKIIEWFCGPDETHLDREDFTIFYCFKRDEAWHVIGRTAHELQFLRLFKIGPKVELSIDLKVDLYFMQSRENDHEN